LIGRPSPQRSRCQPKYGLPAHTTMAGALRIGLFAKRDWRCSKTDRRPRFLNSASPHPSFRRNAAGSKRAGEFIGPDRVVAPIGIDGPSRRCREEWPAERMYQDGYWKNLRHIAHEAHPRLFNSLSSPRGYSHGSATLACYRNGTIQAKRCESVVGPGHAAGPTGSAKSVLRCDEWVELFPVSSMKHRSDNCCSGWV
jgi:hypothetical protein